MLVWLLPWCAAALPPYATPPAPAPQVSEDPFSWEVRYEPDASRIVAVLGIPAEHTVYRDQVEVDVQPRGDVVVGKPDLPRGESLPDPIGRKPREQFLADLVVYLPVRRGEGFVTLELSHQGCRPGLCYPPETEEHVVMVRAQTGLAE